MSNRLPRQRRAKRARTHGRPSAARGRPHSLARSNPGGTPPARQTDAGKARAAQNALKHGQRTRARMIELRKIRHVLRVAAANVAAVNALIALAKAKRTLVPPQLMERLGRGARPE